MRQITFILSLLFALIILPSTQTQAQGERKAIIFTGIVIGGDNERLPSAYISIPRAGKGTMADSKGYFAIPVYPGDSIVFTYVGYKKQYHLVPKDHKEEAYSAIVGMREDINMLAEVRVYPYNSEEEFKKAFLEMQLPNEVEREAIAKSMNPDYINRMAAAMPNNAQTNFRYMIDQQMFGRDGYANKGFATTMPFLNPLAWSKFIKSVKNGDLKQKEWRKSLGETPRENVTRMELVSPTERPKKNFEN